MSITGPGCEACEFKGTVSIDDAPFSMRKPCDACGGFSQFAAAPTSEWRDRPPTRDEMIAHADGELHGAPWQYAVTYDGGPLYGCTHFDGGEGDDARAASFNVTGAIRWRPLDIDTGDPKAWPLNIPAPTASKAGQ